MISNIFQQSRRGSQHLPLDRLLQPRLGVRHHLRAQPHHQHAELLLVERPVPVHVPFPHHRRRILRRHPRHPQRRRVPPQALRRYDPPPGLRQQPEAPAQLRHELLRFQPLGHHRQQVLVLLRLRRSCVLLFLHRQTFQVSVDAAEMV
ncbi:unnamed protein product [Musa hybrid cultivar]